MAAEGVGWVRFSTAWRGEEPTAPFEGQAHYDFQFLDSVMSTLARENLSAELTLYTTPVWAADGTDPEGCTVNIAPRPQVVSDFANYAAAVAGRYAADGPFWAENPELPVTPPRAIEIWNEPNWNAFWCPEPNPELWAEMFVAAAKAVRDADPRQKVITGGLTSVFADDTEAVSGGMDAGVFMARAVEHEPEVADLADAVGFHPYDLDVRGVEQRIARFRAALDELGLEDVPIEVNEAGWPTEGTAYPKPEEERAALTAELAEHLWNSPCDISALALYTWRTNEADVAASADFYGIADPDTAELRETGERYLETASGLSDAPRQQPSGNC
jgi:hypothetical protein